MWRAALVLGLIVLATAPAVAGDCLDELDARGVAYHRIKQKGIAIAVEIDGPLGGVTYHAADRALWLDCSLAVSLDEAGPYLTALGITDASFSSSFSKRNVRGTHKPSKHSYALAIDLHTFAGDGIGALDVSKDFEQGLGDAVDCIGAPLTEAGAILSTLRCQLVQSGLFRLVLTPDYDDAHHNHFHLEARVWGDREALRATSPAIH
jgi:hypothetical protein